jgi:hypothetical protein
MKMTDEELDDFTDALFDALAHFGTSYNLAGMNAKGLAASLTRHEDGSIDVRVRFTLESPA